MKKMATDTLIGLLQGQCDAQLEAIEKFKTYSIQELQAPSSTGGWSVLQCVEHLNRYYAFYLPELERNIKKLKTSDTFHSGWLGNYLAENILPKPGMRTMRTFRSKDPAPSEVDVIVLERFAMHVKHMRDLVKELRAKDPGSARCKTTLGSWISIRVGDTFRFVLNHNQRHLEQAMRNVL